MAARLEIARAHSRRTFLRIARVLAQPDLINYFYEELKTLPPAVADAPLFQKMRAGLSAIKN